MTQRKQAEEAVRQARDDLARANVELERKVQERTAKLREMVDELEHFSYTITHDMRAPLRAMFGFAELMEQSGADLSKEHKEFLDHIKTSARRMDSLITDALSYSKAVQQELILTPIDAAALLRGMISSYPAFQPPQARIEIDGELPQVLANEAGLTQCFSNLLNNAVKFVRPGQVPQVRIWAEGVAKGSPFALVRIWFEDNGIGIPEQLQGHLFQMFQRASRAYEGTGIGLALVRKVTERMGGRVGAESKPGQGSRFWVELKAAQ